MSAPRSNWPSGPMLLMAFIAAIAFLLQGYDQGVFNGLVSLNSFVEAFPLTKTVGLKSGHVQYHHARIQGTVVAIYEVGCAIGSLSCWFLGDRLGRRRTVQFMGIIVIIGTAIQASAFSMGQLIFGRIFTGLGVGGYTATVPMWISECSPANSRGPMVLVCGGFAISGIVLASWIDFGFYFIRENQVSWRFPVAFQAVFAIAVTLLSPILPESPRWLVKKDQPEDALRVLLHLRRDNHSEAEGELLEIEETLRQERMIKDQSPFAVNEHKQYWRTILAIGINTLAQMSGVNTITFFSTSTFQQQLHYDGVQSRIFSACIQVWQALWAWGAILLVAKFRRRVLVMGAAGVMSATFCIITGLVSISDKNINAAKASIAFDFVAIAAFPVGLFLLPMMYAAEISNLAVRHKVTAMASCANWLFNFLVAEVTPIAFNTIGYRYYIVYIAINAFTVVTVFLFYPETKGRSLEDIDVIFQQSNSIFDTVWVANRYEPAPLPSLEHKRHSNEFVENLQNQKA